MAPAGISGVGSPRATRRARSVSKASRNDASFRKGSRGAGIEPSARRLLLVGQWAARGFIMEGGGWVQPAFPESGAFGRRGELVASQKRA